MTLYEILVMSAAAAVPSQHEDGSMRGGHNGPYHDPETPVRNTGHWLITFLKAYEISRESRFLKAARGAVDYLCSRDARPYGATFWHRFNTHKDSCNGLIGQAWTVEALAAAAQSIGNANCRQRAEVVFMLHPFDDELGLWRIVDVDGSPLDFDRTFNHQLWFAAAGSLLLPSLDERLKQRITRFTDCLPANLSLYGSGLIHHEITSLPMAGNTHGIRRGVRALRSIRRAGRRRDAMHKKSIGYHAFNLYAFALLRRQIPEHLFWRSVALLDALHYMETTEYAQGIEDNTFGYAYNPPGFEVAFALHEFSDDFGRDVDAEVSRWVSSQLSRCYDFGSSQMSLGTEDPLTHAARVYEATRLPDLVL